VRKTRDATRNAAGYMRQGKDYSEKRRRSVA
jgi:hypothetical protein